MRLKGAFLVLAVSAIWIGTSIPLAPPAHADEVDWWRALYTRDDNRGGAMEWHRKERRVKLCDEEDDDRSVRLAVSTGGRNSHDSVYTVQGDGTCEDIAVYADQRNSNPNYQFKLCLIKPGGGESHCSKTDSASWRPDNKWPQGNPPCHKLWSWDEEAKKYCVFGERKPDAMVTPPTWRDGMDTHPDKKLPYGHAALPPGVNGPLKTVLLYVKWFALGGCVAGFILVGAKMAIKHKRSEAGAHVAGLTWVMVASIVAGTGLAAGFISLLLSPK